MSSRPMLGIRRTSLHTFFFTFPPGNPCVPFVVPVLAHLLASLAVNSRGGRRRAVETGRIDECLRSVYTVVPSLGLAWAAVIHRVNGHPSTRTTLATGKRIRQMATYLNLLFVWFVCADRRRALVPWLLVVSR